MKSNVFWYTVLGVTGEIHGRQGARAEPYVPYYRGGGNAKRGITHVSLTVITPSTHPAHTQHTPSPASFAHPHSPTRSTHLYLMPMPICPRSPFIPPVSPVTILALLVLGRRHHGFDRHHGFERGIGGVIIDRREFIIADRALLSNDQRATSVNESAVGAAQENGRTFPIPRGQSCFRNRAIIVISPSHSAHT